MMIAKINKKIDNMQLSYFGIMSISLLACTCLASVALLAVLSNEAPMWQLVVLACTAMASNAAAIAHSPLRWVVWLVVVNVVLSLLLITINLS